MLTVTFECNLSRVRIYLSFPNLNILYDFQIRPNPEYCSQICIFSLSSGRKSQHRNSPCNYPSLGCQELRWTTRRSFFVLCQIYRCLGFGSIRGLNNFPLFSSIRYGSTWVFLSHGEHSEFCIPFMERSWRNLEYNLLLTMVKQNSH